MCIVMMMSPSSLTTCGSGLFEHDIYPYFYTSVHVVHQLYIPHTHNFLRTLVHM